MKELTNDEFLKNAIDSISKKWTFINSGTHNRTKPLEALTIYPAEGFITLVTHEGVEEKGTSLIITSENAKLIAEKLYFFASQAERSGKCIK